MFLFAMACFWVHDFHTAAEKSAMAKTFQTKRISILAFFEFVEHGYLRHTGPDESGVPVRAIILF